MFNGNHRMEYIKIGNQGFHFDATDIRGASWTNLKYLGDINSNISRKGDKKYSEKDYKRAIKFLEDYLK